MRHNLLSLTADLRKLGIKEGDILFVIADLGQIGSIEGNIGDVILNSLLNAVGKEGTIVTNSYTKSFFLSWIDRNYVFDEKTPAESGSLANLFLAHPEHIRSKHPTNSFVAIGKHASAILQDHNETRSSYYPLQKITEYNGKHMLLGCVDSNNGLPSIHLAQEMLGLTKRNIMSGKIGVCYKIDDKIKIFKRMDVGGCSRGFYKFYSHLIVENLLISGLYGDAYSVLTDAKRSLTVVYDILKKDPRFALCDDPNCFSCRGTRLYNKRDMPIYYIRNLNRLIGKYFSR